MEKSFFNIKNILVTRHVISHQVLIDSSLQLFILTLVLGKQFFEQTLISMARQFFVDLLCEIDR